MPVRQVRASLGQRPILRGNTGACTPAAVDSGRGLARAGSMPARQGDRPRAISGALRRNRGRFEARTPRVALATGTPGP